MRFIRFNREDPGSGEVVHVHPSQIAMVDEGEDYGFPGKAILVMNGIQKCVAVSVAPDEAVAMLTAPAPDDDPAVNWCSGEGAKGGRCLFDAVRDGLCKKHWRQAHAEDVADAG